MTRYHKVRRKMLKLWNKLCGKSGSSQNYYLQIRGTYSSGY